MSEEDAAGGVSFISCVVDAINTADIENDIVAYLRLASSRFFVIIHGASVSRRSLEGDTATIFLRGFMLIVEGKRNEAGDAFPPPLRHQIAKEALSRPPWPQ